MALWGKIDNEASKPKYLNDADKAATLGIDVAEAQTTANIAKGLNTPGWVKYSTYTDANGNVRNKSEVLVAMASITGDNDATPPNTTTITITEQPIDATVLTGDTASFTVDYTLSNETSTATIAWQVSTDGTTWTPITGGTNFDLEVDSTDPEYVDGNQFRAVVTSGSTVATSNAATLTVTTE